MTALPPATIRVSRISAPWRDRSVVYKVLVDGHEAGRLKGAMAVDIPVAVGEHRLRIKIWGGGSEELCFNTEPGCTASFTCEPAGTSATAVADLLSRQNWVTLKHEVPGGGVTSAKASSATPSRIATISLGVMVIGTIGRLQGGLHVLFDAMQLAGFGGWAVGTVIVVRRKRRQLS